MEEYRILKDDRILLDARIDELESEIQGLGPDFYEVFNQSSETWHDNAPFEALRDKQSVLFAEYTSLKEIRRNSTVITPKRGTRVAIGSTVTLDDNRKIFVAGDWTPHAGQTIDGMTFVSARSPLALAVIGKQGGSTTPFGTITTLR